MKIPDVMPVIKLKICPRCKEPEMPDGDYLVKKVPVNAGELLDILPLPGFVKYLIRKVKVAGKLMYCSKCGFLKIKFLKE